MSHSDLNSLIAAGEGETLEFKREPVRDICQDIAAFASTRGGIVVVGVTDDGEIVGVDDFDVARGQVQNWIHEFVFPSPGIQTSRVTLDGRHLLVIDIQSGDHPAYSYKNRHYYRNGESSQIMLAPELHRRYAEAEVQSQLRRLGESIERVNPARNTAAAISGQGELATMNYGDLLGRLIKDLCPYFRPR